MSKIKRVSTGSYVAPATEVNRAIDQINKKFGTIGTGYSFGPVSSASVHLGLDTVSVGPKVTFTKTNYGSEVDVIIPGVLELTRGNNGGIYNSALQTDYYDGSQETPTNTEWNSQWTDYNLHGWHPLTNLSVRSWGTWKAAMDNNPPHQTGRELIMHEITTDRFWLIKFTQWTSNDSGGGFSYERYELYPVVQVVKNDYDDSFVDVIEPGKTEFKRDNYGAIYNRVLETQFNGDNAEGGDYDQWTSPKGVEWNSYHNDQRQYYNGFEDLSNVRNRKYTNLWEACNRSIGGHIGGLELVMHDLSTDRYWKFQVSGWTGGGNGGGMTYTRQIIPLDAAVQFADGTAIKSVQDIQDLITTNTGGSFSNFNQSLNTGDSVSFNVVNANGFAAQTIEANSNGQVDNIKIGDDCWIGDGDLANGFVIKGQQAFNQGHIKLGNNPNAPVIGNLGSQHFGIRKMNGTASVPEYADNTAAITAGLVVGDIYRTGDLLKIVH